MFDPSKAVGDAEAAGLKAVHDGEAEAVGFFQRPVPMWAVLAALAVGALLGKVF